jgi:hypothetical protein
MRVVYRGKPGEKVLRILLLLLPVMVIYFVIRWFQATPAQEINKKVKKLAWLFVILLLLLLAATGKLNVVFAMLGVVIAFIVRLMPVLLNYAPQLHRVWQLFGASQRQQNDSHSSRPVSRGGMSRAEALDVLGLKPNASKQEIIDAHRKLISKLHPDRGGSDYLAAQINLAKKTLIND